MEWREVASRIEAGEDRNIEFKRDTFGFVLTEKQVIPSASIEDIDPGAFRSFLRAQGLDTGEEPQPPIADDLRNRRGKFVRVAFRTGHRA